MLIGLTYDLRSEYRAMGYSEEETAELDKEETVDGIDHALCSLGFKTERIGNIFNCAKRLCAGDRWDLVFNIAEGMHTLSRESQVPALLDAYRIPYTFSEPLTLSVSLHKETTKRIVRSVGVPTPDSAVVSTAHDIAFVNLPYPLFVKPVAEGTSKGVDRRSHVSTRHELETACIALLEKFHQPVLVETYLSGREVTVGILGTGNKARCAGIMEVIPRDGAEEFGYSYANKMNYEEVIEYRLATDDSAQEAARTALKAWRGLDCRDGGRIDMRANDAGIWNFIEVNPLAGLNPAYSDLPIMWRMAGRDYTDLIAQIMQSALERNGMDMPS